MGVCIEFTNQSNATRTDQQPYHELRPPLSEPRMPIPSDQSLHYLHINRPQDGWCKPSALLKLSRLIDSFPDRLFSLQASPPPQTFYLDLIHDVAHSSGETRFFWLASLLELLPSKCEAYLQLRGGKRGNTGVVMLILVG